MFLDDYVIERTENITRRVNVALKHGPPVIERDQPWEKGQIYLFGTPMYDREEQIFKMWYYCDGGAAYATSKDGLTWEKPELDVVLRDGKKTNMVMERAPRRGERGPYGYLYEFFNVIKDETDPDPTRRYKAGFLGIDFAYSGEFEDPYHRGQRRGLGTAVSPDGIHWTLENEWASHEICDGMTCVLWDRLKKRYVAYGRTKVTPDKNDGRWAVHGWGRGVNRIESEDFRTWSKGELVMAADSKDPEGTEIYSLSVFPYEGVQVGLVQMFYGPPGQFGLDIQLAVSRDGRTFTRVEPRTPFIAEGPVGSWDRFNMSVGMPPIEVGDELWFYYSGRTRRHGPYNGKDTGPKVGRIGFAKIKRGRFVSLEASFDRGTVLTKPIKIEGSQVYLNADTTYGLILVALLDDEGNLADREIWIRQKEGIEIPVFKPEVMRKVAGRELRIRFTISNAQLYGFSVK